MILRQILRIANALELYLSGSAPAVSDATRARVYYDTATLRPYLSANGGAYHVLPVVMGAMTASATVANTTTATTIVGTVTGGKTLAANSLVAGKSVRIRASGVLSSVSQPNLTVLVKFGSVTVATTGAVAQVGTPSNAGWELDVIVTCRTAGASGTVFAQGLLRYGANLVPLAATAAVTVDTTAAAIIDVTAQWGAASASNTITATNALFEILN